jgi:hypothetical protein
MQDWLKTFHGGNQAFPAVEIAVKVAVALALGLLVGFEREWSNKDIGVRTFAMTALLGLLGTLPGPPLLILSGVTADVRQHLFGVKEATPQMSRVFHHIR